MIYVIPTLYITIVRKVDRRGTVMLAPDDSLRLLCNNSQQVFSDGTFRYAPYTFEQMYTFNIFKDGFYIPVAYFLIQQKPHADVYVNVLNMLKDECEGLELSLNVGAFTVDFELAMLKAIRSPPQTNSGVGQTIQVHCGKLEPFSAIDFQRFGFLSIFTIHTVNLKKIYPFSTKRRSVEIWQNSMTLYTMSWTLIGDKSK